MPGATRQTDAFGRPWREGKPGFEESLAAEVEQAQRDGRPLPKRSRIPVGAKEIEEAQAEGRKP
jgi:hypothetical protein